MDVNENPEVVRAMQLKLVQEAADALDEVVALEEVSTTDAMNRAIQVYAFLAREIRAGKRVYLQDREGEMAQVTIL